MTLMMKLHDNDITKVSDVALKRSEISSIRKEWRLWDDTKIVSSWVLGIDPRPQHYQFCCRSFVPHSLDVKTSTHPRLD